MSYNRSLTGAVVKSTFLTILFFTLFDIFTQGYSSYHNWSFPVLIIVAAIYYLIIKYNITFRI